jgi:hypothetical protein
MHGEIGEIQLPDEKEKLQSLGGCLVREGVVDKQEKLLQGKLLASLLVPLMNSCAFAASEMTQHFVEVAVQAKILKYLPALPEKPRVSAHFPLHDCLVLFEDILLKADFGSLTSTVRQLLILLLLSLFSPELSPNSCSLQGLIFVLLRTDSLPPAPFRLFLLPSNSNYQWNLLVDHASAREIL